VAFGGQALQGDQWVNTDETWTYDVDTNVWTDMKPDPHPVGINYPAFVYDEQSDLIVLYGWADRGESLLWTYDVDTNTWTDLDITGGPEKAPAYARGIYHPASDRIVLFGGWHPDSDDARNDVWAYDVDSNTWSGLAPNSITGLVNHTFTYVGSIDQAIAFGGGPSFTEFNGDRLLIYDPSVDAWHEVDRPS